MSTPSRDTGLTLANLPPGKTQVSYLHCIFSSGLLTRINYQCSTVKMRPLVVVPVLPSKGQTGQIPHLLRKVFSFLLLPSFSPLPPGHMQMTVLFSEASANEATAFVSPQDNDRVQFSQSTANPPQGSGL